MEKYPPAPPSQSNSHHHLCHWAPQAFLLTDDLWMCLAVCVLVCLPASIQSVSLSKYCCFLYSFEIFAIFNRISMFFNPFFLYNLIYLYLFEEMSLLPSRDVVGSSVCFCYCTSVCVCVSVIVWMCSFQCVRAHTGHVWLKLVWFIWMLVWHIWRVDCERSIETHTQSILEETLFHPKDPDDTRSHYGSLTKWGFCLWRDWDECCVCVMCSSLTDIHSPQTTCTLILYRLCKNNYIQKKREEEAP